MAFKSHVTKRWRILINVGNTVDILVTTSQKRQAHECVLFGEIDALTYNNMLTLIQN